MIADNNNDNNALQVLKLLTTLRYTPTPHADRSTRGGIDLEACIPLLSRHVHRLIDGSRALMDLKYRCGDEKETWSFGEGRSDRKEDNRRADQGKTDGQDDHEPDHANMTRTPHGWQTVKEDDILSELTKALEDKLEGDWRVRILVSHDGIIEIQTYPMPLTAVPFNPYLPSSPTSSNSSRSAAIPTSTTLNNTSFETKVNKSKIILDPSSSAASTSTSCQDRTHSVFSSPASQERLSSSKEEEDEETVAEREESDGERGSERNGRLGPVDDFCLRYKTTRRGLYEEAAGRGKSLRPDVFDTLMHQRPASKMASQTHDAGDDLITELTFSNIAFEIPTYTHESEGPGSGPQEVEWVTPAYDPLHPFLRGVMRQELLDEGRMRERRITVREVGKWAQEGRRMVGMNGLRGVWEAELVQVET